MERLTEHHVNKSLGAYMVCSMDCVGDDKDFLCNDCRRLEEMVNRLAAYEDTGLEPEAVKEHEAAYIEIMTRTYGPFHQKIGKWLQAETDGRLVVLPCKVGQTIWVESCIRGRSTSIEAPDIEWIIENAERFGAEIFLTREEAEAAMKKREADNAKD